MSYSYYNVSEYTEGSFYKKLNGRHYEGRYVCDIDVEMEYSSEYGWMGVTDCTLNTDSERIYVYDANLGEEVSLCRDKYEDIYEWIRNKYLHEISNIDLADEGEVWEYYPEGYFKKHPAIGEVSRVGKVQGVDCGNAIIQDKEGNLSYVPLHKLTK